MIYITTCLKVTFYLYLCPKQERLGATQVKTCSDRPHSVPIAASIGPFKRDLKRTNFSLSLDEITATISKRCWRKKPDGEPQECTHRCGMEGVNKTAIFKRLFSHNL